MAQYSIGIWLSLSLESTLKSWIEVLRKDPQAIFSAAKDADLIAGYLLNLEREWTAMQEHKEWVREFDGKEVAR